jgi:ubiquinone biosynthesis protein
MSISLKPDSIKRYVSIARLLIKHGREDWVQQMGWDSILRESGNGELTPVESGKAEELARDLEGMGPTFVKLGQLLSSRADLLPPAYLESLARLQDDIEPFSTEEAEKIISTELGVRLSRAFSEFDPKPIAAASLGQVYFAKLRDERPVAVKVQRPGIREQVVTDFEALQTIAEFLDAHTDFGKKHGYQRHLDEIRKSFMDELDYRLEADNLKALGRNLAEFKRLIVPQPVDGYCSSRVLTMDQIIGTKITTVSPVVLLELNGQGLARELFDAYLKQVLVDGFFHADPHPGNLLLTEDQRIALLDLGMVARVTPGIQQGLLKLLLAISEGRGEDVADEAIHMGEEMNHFDRHHYRQVIAEFISQHRTSNLEQLNAGRIVLELQRISGENDFRLPQAFTMIGKMLLNIDRVGKTLDPQFNPNEAIRENAMKLMQQRMRKNLSLGSVLQATLETNEFLQQLPKRLNTALDALATKDLRIQVDAIDEAYLLKGLHKIANRITCGLVLASLIIGAALLTRVDTPFKIWGYPGLAMILFACATAGVLMLLFEIFGTDKRHEREVNHPHQKRKG